MGIKIAQVLPYQFGIDLGLDVLDIPLCFFDGFVEPRQFWSIWLRWMEYLGIYGVLELRTSALPMAMPWETMIPPEKRFSRFWRARPCRVPDQLLDSSVIYTPGMAPGQDISATEDKRRTARVDVPFQKP